MAYRKKESYIAKKPDLRAKQLLNLKQNQVGDYPALNVNAGPVDSKEFRMAQRFLDNGKRYGDCFSEMQEKNYFEPLSKFKYVYIEAARGLDKTGSVSWHCLQDLILGRPGQRVYVYSCDKDQSAEDLQDIEGYLKRNPPLQRGIAISKNEIRNKITGSFIRIESSDDVGSFGKKPTRIVAEEFVLWKNRALWDSIFSGTGKVEDCQVIVCSNAGWDYGSFQWKVREYARKEAQKENSEWFFFCSPSAEEIPWISKNWIETQRAILHPSVFARLIQNKWAQESGDFILKQDIDLCIDDKLQMRFTGQDFDHFVGVDLGLVHDFTIVTIVHREGEKVVLDNIRAWKGTKTNSVVIADIEEYLIQTCRNFRVCDISMDTWQMKSTAQKLAGMGLPVNEFTFTTTSLNRLTINLYNLIKFGKLNIYRDEELVRELLQVKLIQTSYGIRIDHESGKYSDRVMSLGIACLRAVDIAELPAPLEVVGELELEEFECLDDESGGNPSLQRFLSDADDGSAAWERCYKKINNMVK